MHKMLQQRPLPYIEWEMPNGFWKGRGSWDCIANIHWLLDCIKEFQRSACVLQTFDCGSWVAIVVLKEMGVAQHVIFLMYNLDWGQESTVLLKREYEEYEETEWVPIGKGIRQGCVLSLYWLNQYAEHIQKAQLDSDEGVQVGGRTISNSLSMVEKHSTLCVQLVLTNAGWIYTDLIYSSSFWLKLCSMEIGWLFFLISCWR